MEIDKIIADNLKRIREQKNLSLSQLSEKTGLSKVMLSQLEKGGSNPTINNIWKIANALDISYTALLDSTGSSAAVIERAQLSPQSSEDGHYRVLCYYASSAERSFEWFQMELDANCGYISVGHRSRALEYLIVQSGVLQIETHGQRYILRSGDAISFQASEPHIYSNLGETIVLANIINYYPV
ncbi:helix-turn-helix domain-containing protein [Anaerotignum sp.]|uniref:helix-turn-helix domain-containing protein n=1 Tax=Anaerotignum sp. TaxID=2039241 RepID=UPI0027152FBF|nr:XRE family transcriptional regulator [Anaerotignum sp.]